MIKPKAGYNNQKKRRFKRQREKVKTKRGATHVQAKVGQKGKCLVLEKTMGVVRSKLLK